MVLRGATWPRGAISPVAKPKEKRLRSDFFSLIASESEKVKVKSESVFGPLNPPKISEVEGLACVIIATRGFCARQNSYKFTGGNLPARGD